MRNVEFILAPPSTHPVASVSSAYGISNSVSYSSKDNFKKNDVDSFPSFQSTAMWTLPVSGCTLTVIFCFFPQDEPIGCEQHTTSIRYERFDDRDEEMCEPLCHQQFNDETKESIT